MGLMPKPSQVILLVEDSRHQQFTLKYLSRLGFNPHSIRVKMSPSGAGSAEQWVREQFPIEFEECRIRHARAGTRLIVVIDADARSVQQRIQELDLALREARLSTASSNTANVVRLIPKRNIETWILCLNNRTVDETANYKNAQNDWAKLIADATPTLYAWTRQNAEVPASCVESLRLGLSELKKLENIHS